MTVAELITALELYRPNLPVVLSRDAEGNSFHRLADVEASWMQAGDADLEPIHPDDLPEYEGEALDEAVYLWPV